MQNGISSGCSTLSVKCQVSNHYPVGGTGETDGDTVWEGGIVRGVSGLVFTCTCLKRTWHEALSYPVWTDSHVYMFGLGLFYLVILRWSRYTPSLRAGNV